MRPLAVVTRNGYIESIHYGIICVIDSQGNVIYRVGEPDTKIFFRSTAKPLQTLPLITSGAAEAYKFTLAEIALACASHTGEPIHQKTAEDILQRLGLSVENLRCGIMRPYDEAENSRLLSNQIAPSHLHSSCSGKHAAILALALHKGYSIDNYEQLDHPIQQEILRLIADFAEEEIESIGLGIDGCGIPIYLLPLRKVALSYAKLISLSCNKNNRLGKACDIIIKAMTSYPEMVSGQNEFCAALMKVTNGRLIAKIGAEAVYCVGVTGDELGICIKIADGAERALFPVVIQVLSKLKLLSPTEQKNLSSWRYSPIFNNNNQIVGTVIPILDCNNVDDIGLGTVIENN